MASLQKILSLVFLVSFSAHSQALNGGKPQSLPSKKFRVCGKSLNLEVADNNDSRMTGLMNRTGIVTGRGMLFVFPDSQVRQFWMRNVSFDIDIGYFDDKGKLVKSMTMVSTSPVMADDALPRYSSEGPARFAVEAEKGFFAKISKLADCRLSPLPGVAKSE